MFGNFPHLKYQFRTNGNWRYPGAMRALPGKASRQPPGPEPVSRDAADADQRRRILAATAELIAEQGYQETTMEEIVRRAKVGYATFYKHYADKEAAFLALLDAAGDRTVSRVEDAYKREEGPWADRVGAALGVLFEDVAAHPAVARAALVEAVAAGPEAAAKHEAALKRLAPLLRPGRELNPRQAELPESLEETLAGGIVWVLGQRLIAGEADKLRGLLPETLEFVLRPYMGEDEAAREAGEVADAISA
jgi:AcrR family transcriptional regulator